VLNSFITSGVSNGQVLLQLGFLNLTDPAGRTSPTPAWAGSSAPTPTAT
jgi:hypothetical protein